MKEAAKYVLDSVHPYETVVIIAVVATVVWLAWLLLTFIMGLIDTAIIKYQYHQLKKASGVDEGEGE